MSNKYIQALFTVEMLKKSAYTWFISHQYIINGNSPARLDWTSLKKDLRSYFRSAEYAFKACQALDTCRQAGQVTGYIRALLQKVNCCNDICFRRVLAVIERSIHIVYLLMSQQSYHLTKTYSIVKIQTKQATNCSTSCFVPYITTQALYIGLYTLVPIVQWYYALQHYSAASCSTAYSTLILWHLPVALCIVCWVLRTVVQLPVAMYYNCNHANNFSGHGTT